jgi:hypothetical protein
MRTNTITVNTDPVQVPLGKGDRPVIVNVGSTKIYFSNDGVVSTSDGLPLGPNVGYEFTGTLTDCEWTELWVVSDEAGGELRYGTVG